MGLETATYLNDLVATNPVGSTDAVSVGDDHLRMIKSVLQATFPAMAGAAWRVQGKSSGYTVVATDNMTVLNCTTALTLALTAAATLGNKFMCLVFANGVDVIVDPNGSETINGVTTLTIPAGQSCILVCTGSAILAFNMANFSGATFTGGINEARGSIVMHATTMDLYAVTKPNVLDGTGSPVTMTACVNAPQAGVRRTLYPIAGSIITHGATFSVDGGVSVTAATGDKWEFEAVTTSTHKVHITKADGTTVGSSSVQIQPITAVVGSNIITVTPGALSLDFRDNTPLTDGTVTKISGTPSALVIAATDSFGLVTAAGNQRLAILAINNAGTMELAAALVSSGVALDETGVITTATAATANTHIKAANVRSNVAYRVIGFVEATFTTATGWGSHTLTQGAGGQAGAAMASLGFGQKWNDVTGSRAHTTVYYNTYKKPMLVSVQVSTTSLRASHFMDVGGVTHSSETVYSAGDNTQLTVLVPPGVSYSLASTNVSSIYKWLELY